MITADGTAVYPWNHGETLTAAALNAAFAQSTGAYVGTGAPGAPAIGTVWYNSGTGLVSIWDGSAWQPTGPATSVGTTAPASPIVGALWFDTTGGLLYMWYDDGNSKQWINVNNYNAPSPATGAYLPLTGGTLTGALAGTTASFSGNLAGQVTSTGSSTARLLADRWHDVVNVKDYGAPLNGTTFDDTAFQNARAAVGTDGSVYVPYGNQRVSAAPTTGPTTQVLWRYDGTHIGTGTATPATGLGTDVVENFFQGNKFFGRSNSFAAVSPVLRIDSTVNHSGGSAANNISAVKVNATNSGTAGESTIGIATVLTENRGSLGANATSVAVTGYTVRTANTNILSYGANFYINDTTGNASATSGQAVGVEMDVLANGLDNGGLAGPYVPAGQGIRTICSVIGAQSNTGGADTEIGWGVAVGPTSGSSHVIFKRAIAVTGQFNIAAFSTQYAVQLAGANAVWLNTGHILAMDIAGTGGAANLRLSSNGSVLTVAGGQVAISALPGTASYANDAAAATGGVAVGQLYRNGSAVMVRVT